MPEAPLQRSRRPKTAESAAAISGSVSGPRLQRSRRPKTAERRLGFEILRPRRVASTEPPSEDGGETTPRRPRTITSACFNGAAVRRRRRAGVDGCRLARLLVASTEPPSEDGGEGLRSAATRARAAGFNGAAVRRRRRGGRGRGASQRSSRSFNGAAVRRRRRVLEPLHESRRALLASTEPPSEDGGEV